MGDIIKFPEPTVEASHDEVVVLQATDERVARVEKFRHHRRVAKIAISDSFSKLEILLERIEGVVRGLPDGDSRRCLDDERRRLACELDHLRGGTAPR